MADIINATIQLLAARPIAFSVQDIVAYASLEGLEDSVEAVLKEKCVDGTILSLDEQQNGTGSVFRNLDWIDPETGEVHRRDDQDGATSSCRYLGRREAEKWWVDRTVRWARAGVDYVSPAQLAGSMSLSFDNHQWDDPPPDLLAIGRRWAMVADGCVPETFVFPWATALRVNPQFIEPFRLLFSSDFKELSLEADDTTIDQVLNRLPERWATIIRKRFGLDLSFPSKLEEIGKLFGITRERVRQLEKKALKTKELRTPVWLMFAAKFVQSGGSLLILDPSTRPHHKLLGKIWELNTAHVEQLNISVIATDNDVASYRRLLSNENVDLNVKDDPNRGSATNRLKFMSLPDSLCLRVAEDKYRAKQVSRTKYRMLRQALLSLGRAAHYSEIAEECNRLFPENQNSIHNWYAALSLYAQPERESLGIVWIGRKGMYGLQEHGYSRPDTALHDEVAQIVKSMFEKTQRPTSVEVVMAELSKKRRDLSRPSVMMALSLNDRLRSVSGGRYIPKTDVRSESSDALHVQYDIDAAFQAFSTDEEND